MNTYADNNKGNKKQQTSLNIQRKDNEAVVLPLADSHPSVIAQIQLQEIADNCSQIKKAIQLQAMVNTHSVLPVQKKEKRRKKSTREI